MRTNLSKGLSFSRDDRNINVLRIGFVANLLTRNGVAVIVSAISPYKEARDQVRRRIIDLVEVFVDVPLEVAAERDVKGLYKKAFAGEIDQFTGVSVSRPSLPTSSSRQTRRPPRRARGGSQRSSSLRLPLVPFSGHRVQLEQPLEPWTTRLAPFRRGSCWLPMAPLTRSWRP